MLDLLRPPVRALKRSARRLRHLGRSRYCPVCASPLRAFVSGLQNIGIVNFRYEERPKREN